MNIPKNHPEADQLLRRKCEIAVALDRIEARLNERINKAKDEATVAGAEIKKEDAALDRFLKTYFATLTPEQLGERKSVRLNFGTFGKRGAREAVRIIRGWTEDLVVAALKSKGWASFIKTVETISRASVLAANAENRALIEKECGLRVEPGETFYVDPDVKALANYGDGTAGGTG